MRILHFLGSIKLPRDPDVEPVGGMTRVALETARAQRALGHEVWVAATGRERWRAEWHGVRLAGLRAAPWARLRVGRREFDFRTRLPAIALTMRHAFDVVQGHEFTRLRFLRAKARVLHVHNAPWSATDPDAVARRARRFWWSARSSDAQVAVSRFVADMLRSGCDDRVSRDAIRKNVHTVYNGVDVLRFAAPQRDGARASQRPLWGVGDSDVVFLFVGAVTPQKGLMHLARAFVEVCRQDRGAHLVIAGSSRLWSDPSGRANTARQEYEESVRTVLAPAVQDGRVHFLGAVSAADIPAVYAASDVVVLPSVVREAFGLVLVEALASGKPVIASAVGGIPEVVGADTGLLTPPGDEAALSSAMRTLAEDAALRGRLAANCRATAMRFTWTRAAQELDTVYASLLNDAHRDAPPAPRLGGRPSHVTLCRARPLAGRAP